MAFVPPIQRSFMDTSRQYSEGALQARSAMRPNVTTTPPGKTVGGAIGAAAGMGMGGAGFAAMTGAKAATGTAAATTGALGLGLGAWTGIGAAVGLAAYLLS